MDEMAVSETVLSRRHVVDAVREETTLVPHPTENPSVTRTTDSWKPFM